MILVFYGTPEENYSQCLMSTRIRRINKTHQIVQGTYVVKQPITNDLEAEVDVYRRDGGGWHPFVKRMFKKVCTEMHTTNGTGYGMTKTFTPSLPVGCPFKAGNYTLAPVVVPRYRKDWNPYLQRVILPMLPSADTWRIDTKIYDAQKKHICSLRVDARLINRFSSQ